MAECPKYITYRKVKETETEVLYEQFLPQTNADRIRMMSDEELAYFLEHEMHECPAPYYENHFDGCLLDDTPEESVTNTECDQCWLEWLKKEVDK